jgi:tripartite motif-containing protein 71
VSPIDGCIYVADSWNNRIQVFDENGVYLKSIDKIDQMEFHYPYSIHIDKKGRIYVSDQSLLRIKVLDSNFNLIRVIGQYGREIGCYSGLCDISTDKDNNIFVCDSGNHRILKFSENGDFILQWGSNGTAQGKPFFVQKYLNFQTKLLITNIKVYSNVLHASQFMTKK